MEENCIFCKIVKGEMKAWIVWEDENYMAFLTPFPNTPGFTVVIPKKHVPSYGFEVEDEIYIGLMKAARTVGKLIDQNLKVVRTGLMMEGFGVNHLHVKLFPMHGIESKEWKPIVSNNPTFYPTYPGMIASNDGPRMSDEELDQWARKIRGEA